MHRHICPANTEPLRHTHMNKFDGQCNDISTDEILEKAVVQNMVRLEKLGSNARQIIL